MFIIPNPIDSFLDPKRRLTADKIESRISIKSLCFSNAIFQHCYKSLKMKTNKKLLSKR